MTYWDTILNYLVPAFGIALVVATWLSSALDKQKAENESTELKKELKISRNHIQNQFNKMSALFYAREDLRKEEAKQRELKANDASAEPTKLETPSPTTSTEESEMMAEFSKRTDRLKALADAELDVQRRETAAREKAQHISHSVRPKVAEVVTFVMAALEKIGTTGELQIEGRRDGNVPGKLVSTYEEQKDVGERDELVGYFDVGGGKNIQVLVRPGLFASPRELMQGTSYVDYIDPPPDDLLRPPIILIRYNTQAQIASPNTGFLITAAGELSWPAAMLKAEPLGKPRTDKDRIFTEVVKFIADAHLDIATGKNHPRSP